MPSSAFIPSLFARTASALLFAFVVGCAAPDVGPPDKPMLDWESRTSSANTVVLSGFAEPGATVEVEREPEFPENFLERTTAVDANTGRFELTVPLERNRSNRFVLRVRDFDGRLSAPSIAMVTQGRVIVEGLELQLDSPTATVGADGKVSIGVAARVSVSDASSRLDRFNIRFRVLAGGMDAGSVVGGTDDQGVARATLVASVGIGNVIVEATIADGSPGQNDGASDTAWLTVAAGDPHTAQLELSADGTTFSPSSRTVPAGTELVARARVLDAAGNRVQAPWTLVLEPAAAGVVTGERILVTMAGPVTVRAVVSGPNDAPVPQPPEPVQLMVVPAGGAGQNENSQLTLSVDVSETAVAGAAIDFETTLVDPWGNEVEASALRVETDDPDATVNLGQHRLELRRAGETSVTFEADRGDGVWITTIRTLTVVPGEPARIVVSLDGATSTQAAPTTVAPGSIVDVSFEVQDAFGNELTSEGLWLDPPAGWPVFGTSLSVPTTPGLWPIVVRAEGGDLSGTAWVRVLAQPPAFIELLCPDHAIAGVPFSCGFEVQDAFGRVLSTEVAWSLSPLSGSDIDGSDLLATQAGTLFVTASAGPAQRTVAVTIRPAVPAAIDLDLNPEIVTAGGGTTLDVSVRDAFGNPVDSPFLVQTDSPGVVRAGEHLTGFTVAGEWDVVASISGTAIQTTTGVTVVPGAASRIVFELAGKDAVVGEAIPFELQLRDAWDNAVGGTPAILVNGAAAPPSLVTIGADSLVFHESGAFTLTATSGDLERSRYLHVHATPDTEAPNVSGWVSPPSDGVHRPGEAPELTLLASDDLALSSLTATVSGGLTTVDGAHDFSPGQPVSEWSSSLPLSLSSDRVGTVSWTATATDSAGGVGTANGSFLVDAHHGRWATAHAYGSATVRSVSIDASLKSPTWAIDVGTAATPTVYIAEAEVDGGDGRVAVVGSAGAVSTVRVLPPGSPRGIAFRNDPTPTWFTGGDDGGPIVLRFDSEDLAPFTTAALGLIDAKPSRIADLTLASDVQRLLVAVESVDASLSGRLWSLPVDAPVIDPAAPAVSNVSLPDLRPGFVCTGDVSDGVYFTGRRYDAASSSTFTGVYTVEFTDGVLGGTVEVVVEEPELNGAGNTIHHAGCVRDGLMIIAGRFETDPVGVEQSGLASIAAACRETCAWVDIATAIESTPSSIGGLGVRSVAGAVEVIITEPQAARIFRVVRDEP